MPIPLLSGPGHLGEGLRLILRCGPLAQSFKLLTSQLLGLLGSLFGFQLLTNLGLHVSQGLRLRLEVLLDTHHHNRRGVQLNG